MSFSMNSTSNYEIPICSSQKKENKCIENNWLQHGHLLDGLAMFLALDSKITQLTSAPMKDSQTLTPLASLSILGLFKDCISREFDSERNHACIIFNFENKALFEVRTVVQRPE